MKTFKIIYNSKRVKNNKFSVLANDKKQAKETFKIDYLNIGGLWSNVLNIVSIEEAKENEDLNEFFKS